MATRRHAARERGGASASLRSLHPGALRLEHPWVKTLDGWPPATAAVAAAVLLVLVAAIDGYTGARVDLSALYLLPIGLATWRLGPLVGTLWAIVATIVWSVMVGTAIGAGVVGGWNAIMRLAGFGAVVLVLAALRRERDTVRTLAGTDHLTGVQNAGSFAEVVELERSRALRYNRPFTLAYLDVDGFRVVNREWGHAAGDQALRLVASTVRENIRRMDSVSRLGGDEFALLLPETGKGAAEVALRKIQARLVEAAGERSLALTVTIGAVVCVGAPESADDLIQRAEALMYAAKEAGKNRVCVAPADEDARSPLAGRGRVS